VRPRLLWTALVLGAALASGCATVAPSAGAQAATAPTTPDPWESWNRKVFALNEGLDNVLLKPLAKTYRDVVPRLVRTGVNNVFGNVGDVWSAANHLLQGKVQNSLEMGMRVLANTFFGLGGLLDPATEMQLTRRSEDFGQTLGRWGLPSGPYLVLPLLGPSSIRDTAGLLVDRRASYTGLLDTDAAAYGLTGLELVSIRTNLLDTTALLDQVALDKYGFVRDAYIARRRDAQYDGVPPLDAFDDEPADAPAKAAPGPAPRPTVAPPAKASQ
jgi:phospholipid-binding lipoprotein MlaA